MTTTAPAPSGTSWRITRLTTPLARAFAGRRFFPLWAVVHHRGRRTGRDLAVPVALLVTPEAFVVTLPWGSGTNWVRNVLAAGGCRVRWKGVDHDVTAPEVIDRARARAFYGRATWWVAERVIKADSFLLLRREPQR
ncbi:nitroreductase/quinone reductase family protein [Pseudonocardia lacus]|uniref:nitroreductase/quinone reductase family protein n=1 Tax=Pseudonocardia lacus TaxID=2835865 RepID=UPI001BDC842F|nr:nitroreductase/quinone reductase family protein [Pseudonocardia lacus]